MMMSILVGICHGVLQRQKLGFDKDYLAKKVLPFLIPKSTQPTLNVSQVCCMTPTQHCCNINVAICVCNCSSPVFKVLPYVSQRLGFEESLIQLRHTS